MKKVKYSKRFISSFFAIGIMMFFFISPALQEVTGPALSVNAAANRKSISPYIYGLNFAKESFANEIDLPVRRWGGNTLTRYNWKNGSANTALDWFYENVHISNAYDWNISETHDSWITQNENTGTDSIITIPMIGYVAEDASSCGFNTDLYGAQQETDVWRPKCGNGIHTNGSPVTGNNPLDTSILANEAFMQDWVSHMVIDHADANHGGVKFYNLDNEPELWSETHRDVHPVHQTYAELVNKSISYAQAIKTVDPNAQTLGYASFGWTGYWYSWSDAKNAEAHGYNCSPNSCYPDYANHGNKYQVEYYLDKMRQYDQTGNNPRLLDYLDLHYYQAGGVALTTAGNSALQARRLRSTRALWDPAYKDESWIGGDDQAPDQRYVRLIPRMHGWVNTYYPGTKLAITEYNWGGLEHINGALTQADVLGIFGREGLDLATLWNYPLPNGDPLDYDHFETLPGAFAFRMYRNYDGSGSKFGDVSIQAVSGDQSLLAIYAAQRTGDNALTLMIINKTGGALTSPVALSNFNPNSTAKVYRYSTLNLSVIVRQADQAVNSTGFSAAFPANSITLIVIPLVSGPSITGFAPTSGSVGSSVTITGNNFTGATAVSFNDVAATFTVNSSTQITATVPNNAATGAIRVTTANGTGTSSSNFTVNIPDTDSDGLNDQQEAILGTSPNDPDSDDDGFNDGQEAGAGTNALSNTSFPGTLKITADNQYVLYVNGVQVGTNSNWADVESFLVNTDAELNIGIEATDTGGIAALACQITHANDKHVSDFTWQVSNTLIPNWQSNTADHSTWVNATEHFPMGQGPWGNTFTNQFTSGVKWIWSSDANNHNKTYFWTKYNPGQNAIIKATGDNAIDVYVDDTLIGSGNNWTQVEFIPSHIEAGDVIGLYGKDTGGIGAVLAEILYRDNLGSIQRLVTDTSWKCTTTFVSGWTDEDFDDSNWPSALSYGARGGSPWGNTGSLGNISNVSQWIWSNQQSSDNDVWMRKEIPNATLNITCDNQCEVYVNGIKKDAVTTWTSPKAIGLNLSNGDALAIKGMDQGGLAGVLASLSYNNGILVTNNSWKVSNQLQTFWNTNSFDDSAWARAKSYGSNGVLPWSAVSGIAGQAHWIWTSDRYNDDTVYLRYTVGQSNTGTGLTSINTSSDDSFNLYYNGELLLTGTSWQQGKQAMVELEPNDVISIEGNDSGYKAGLILEMTGAYTLKTDTTWKTFAAPVPPAQWNSKTFNDSAWIDATSYGVYGAVPWGKNIAGFNTNSAAQWIWSNKNQTGSSSNDKKVFFRKKVT
jgi:hypothetical protein